MFAEDEIQAAYKTGPVAIVRNAIIAGQPWRVLTVRVIRIDGDTLYYTTDGVWFSTHHRTPGLSNWELVTTDGGATCTMCDDSGVADDGSYCEECYS